MRKEKELRKFPHLLDYSTSIYEQRAYRIMRNLNPRQFKRLIPGMNYYINHIDRAIAEATRTDEHIGSEALAKANEVLD